MNRVQNILNEIAALENEERNQLFKELIDFENFKTQKKVAQQKSALNALIGAGSSGHSNAVIASQLNNGHLLPPYLNTNPL